jgi:purine nucleosidase
MAMRLQTPLHAGAEHALAGTRETAQSVLGEDGMRSTGLRLGESESALASTDAVVALVACCAFVPDLTLVATGPLTNVAQALAQGARPARIVLMGGSSDRGNHTPAAEFNIYADPEAAALVFASGVPIAMFGLNVCRQVALMQAHVQAIRALDAVLGDHVDGYQRIRSSDGSAPMPLYDPCVALYLLRPDLFTLQSAQVDVELNGQFTRGMTVCDFKRASHVQVATQANGPAAIALLLQTLETALV